MKTYSVDFCTGSGCAIREFKAQSDKEALGKARAFADERADELAFSGYENCQPVNEIRVRDADGNEVATWYDNEMRLRLAAGDLLDAAELALRELRRSSSGDESEAVRALIAAIAKAGGGQT